MNRVEKGERTTVMCRESASLSSLAVASSNGEPLSDDELPLQLLSWGTPQFCKISRVLCFDVVVRRSLEPNSVGGALSSSQPPLGSSRAICVSRLSLLRLQGTLVPPYSLGHSLVQDARLLKRSPPNSSSCGGCLGHRLPACCRSVIYFLGSQRWQIRRPSLIPLTCGGLKTIACNLDPVFTWPP